ncbi:MAG: hypothetical protein JWP94_3862 [Mucilaginibacter sp.]|nr:hypothetical protein [Mucilaginibacter sp.]
MPWPTSSAKQIQASRVARTSAPERMRRRALPVYGFVPSAGWMFWLMWKALALEFRPGVEDPVVVPAGQEFTPVLGHGRGGVHEDPLAVLGLRRCQGGSALAVEDEYVDAARPGLAPAQIPGRHDEGGFVAQDLTQVVQLASPPSVPKVAAAAT